MASYGHRDTTMRHREESHIAPSSIAEGFDADTMHLPTASPSNGTNQIMYQQLKSQQ